MKYQSKLVMIGIVIFLIAGCGDQKSGAQNEPEMEIPSLDQNQVEKAKYPPVNSEVPVGPVVPNPDIPGGFSSWEEINRVDPEASSLLILDGIDPAIVLFNAALSDPAMWEDESCSVYIMAEYTNQRSELSYILRTSFGHGVDSSPFMIVALSDSSVMNILGTSLAKTDEVYLRLSEPGNIYSVRKISLKWFHINHYDTFSCESLVVR